MIVYLEALPKTQCWPWAHRCNRTASFPLLGFISFNPPPSPRPKVGLNLPASSLALHVCFCKRPVRTSGWSGTAEPSVFAQPGDRANPLAGKEGL